MAKICIIGTGLIGTSLGLALKQSALGPNNQIIGTDRDRQARAGAQKRGAFDKVEDRLFNAVDGSDVIILATPVMAMRELMQTIASGLKESAIVTDVGSAKRVALEWADELLPPTVNFVGGHPMAGKETPGPENADAQLFKDKTYCIIPSLRASEASVNEVVAIAQAVGAKPFFVGVDEHDSFVAAVSHLPFMASVALMRCASQSVNWDDISQVAASGFRDLTRLASGDVIMHRDICVSNAKPIVAWLDAYIRELLQLRNLLDAEPAPDSAKMQQVLEDAHTAREMWLAGKARPGRGVDTHRELPTFAEGMGEMFVGRRLMDYRKKLMQDWQDGKRDGDNGNKR